MRNKIIKYKIIKKVKVIVMTGLMISILFTLCIPLTSGATGTFGYNTKAKTAGLNSNYIAGTSFVCPQNGVAQSITVWLDCWQSTLKAKCAIYSGDRTTLIGTTEEKVLGLKQTWQTFNFITQPNLVAGTSYYLVSWANSGTDHVYNYYSSVSGYTSISASNTYGSTWPSSLSGTTNSNRVYSIYCTYTTGTETVVVPTVTTSAATGTSCNSTTLNGNLGSLGGASSCQVWFEYGSSISYGSTTTQQSKTSIGSFSSVVSLSESTTYHYRFVGSNSAGTTYGSDVTFTTPACGGSGGTTYYVSTGSGNDNNGGTSSAPWKTIQKAANTVTAGDTVLVKGGTYNEIVTITKDGTSSNRITFKNFGNEVPIIDGTGKSADGNGILNINGASYVTVDGFTVQNSNYMGIRVYGNSNIIVQNCKVYYTDYSSIRVEGGASYCTIQNNYFYGENKANVFTFAISASNHITVKNNHVVNSYKGIDCVDGSSYITITGNSVETSEYGICADPWNADATDYTITGNYVSGSASGGIWVGNPKESSPQGDLTNVYIYNNVLTNTGHGIVTGYNYNCVVSNINIINNNFNVGGTGVALGAGAVSNVVVRNNILKGSVSYKSGSTITQDHNFVLGDPKWVNPSAGDYHLQSTSPCINAGSSTGAPATDYYGSARVGVPDIGAAEYSGTPPVVVVPTVTTSAATGTSCNSTTLNGNLGSLGGASSCQVWFEYGSSISYGSTTTQQSKTSIGSFSSGVSLSESTTYHFRAAASNSAGTVYGSDMTVTTPACGNGTTEGFATINSVIANPNLVTSGGSSIITATIKNTGATDTLFVEFIIGGVTQQSLTSSVSNGGTWTPSYTITNIATQTVVQLKAGHTGTNSTYVYDSTQSVNITIMVTGTGTFGYNTKAKTVGLHSNYIAGTSFVCPQNGVAQSITVWLDCWQSTLKAKCAIYSGDRTTLIGTTEEKVLGNKQTWQTFNFITQPNLVAGTSYYLVSWANSGTDHVYTYYSSVSGYTSISASNTYGSTWPSSLSGTTNSNRVYSIYCTYAASGGSPSLAYTPSSYNFGSMTSGNITSTTFTIWNSGTGTLAYTLGKSASWVTISPMSGNSTGEQDTITVNIDTTGLSGGSYTCPVSISSNGGTGTFIASLVIYTISPALAYTPSSYSFGTMQAGQNTSTNFTIWNSGTETLAYTLSESTSWLTVFPISGTSTGEHDTITISIDTMGLSYGSYTGPISINNWAGTFTVSVTIGAVPNQSFTIIALPDTQEYTYAAGWNDIFYAQAQWIVDHKTSLNIVAVTGEGDITSYATDREFTVANTAYATIENAGIPVLVPSGDHDSQDGFVNYNNYFPVSRYSGKSWYGGTYNNCMANSYILFSAGGMDFIMITIQHESQTAAMRSWANTIIQQYSNRRAILITHCLLDVDATWEGTGQAVYDTVKGNSNLFLMLCGHMHTPGGGVPGGEARRTETYNGHTVNIVLADYQDVPPYWGNGFLRIMTFTPSLNQIHFQTYTPLTKGSITPHYETGPSSDFILTYNMN